MAGKTSSKKDFDAPALVKTTEDHEERLKGLESRLNAIENRVGTNEVFGKTFVDSLKNFKTMSEEVNRIIDDHDNHKIKVTFTSAGKFLLNAAIGTFVAWLVVQAILIPQYSLKIDSLQQQLDEIRKTQP